MRNLPRSFGVTFFHDPSKAFRAAVTAISTSFSVASETLVMTSSVEGLMTSKVLPSTLWTNSLLMNLRERLLAWDYGAQWDGELYRCGAVSDVQASGLGIFAGRRRVEFCRDHFDELDNFNVMVIVIVIWVLGCIV